MSIVIPKTPDMSAKYVSGDNTVILDSIDGNGSTTNITSDELYIDVENTSAKDTTDTDILSIVCDPKMKSVTGKLQAQTTSVADTSQYKITTYAEIHKEATSPKFQPSVVLTDCRGICSDISLESIDGPDNRTIAGKFNYND